ncbi:MAG: helix-turn-helix transcriptional regulator [Chloroflexi bacterium]|nr:helix-turn-helix transcriptional regulator [Chloroflexota bacterium]
MSTFSNRLREQMKNEEFRKEYYKTRFFDEISMQIIKLRNKRGLSQADLAEKAETTQAVISRIENGSVSASTSTIQKLAEAMGAVVRIDIVPNEEMRYAELYSEPFFSFCEIAAGEEQEEAVQESYLTIVEPRTFECHMFSLGNVFQAETSGKVI